MTKSLRVLSQQRKTRVCSVEEEDTHHKASYTDATNLLAGDSFDVTLGPLPPDDWIRTWSDTSVFI